MTKHLLKPSCDSKTRYYTAQKNTFGLLPGRSGTCPGATTGKGGCWRRPDGHKNHTCYVDNLMKIYGGVKGVLAHNTRLLRKADKATKVELLDAEFKRFSKAEGRKDTPNLHYRLHWSGDIFDVEYAEALNEAMTVNSDIHFWAYTRSLFAVPILATVPNLNLYISLDPVNYSTGMSVYQQNKPDSKKLAVCYMAPESGNDSREDGIKFTACPADTKKVPKEGACSLCRLCTGKQPRNVWFKT